MISIKKNKKLLDKHIQELNKKLIEKLEKIDISQLSKDTLCCLSEIYRNSELILKAEPDELRKIIEYFKSNFYTSIGYEENKNQELYLILSEIFIDKSSGLYKNFTNYKNEYDAYEFVKSIDMKTCPYCNREYIFVVDKKSGKLRPEIDHFYPKSLYPFLSISFYNLIPSCSTCNHTKKDKDSLSFNLINPYEVKKDEISLTYIPTDVKFLDLKKDKYSTYNFEIKFTNLNSNIDIFKLEELYKQHKDIVLDLLIKKAYYPETYIEELKIFGFNKDEIYRYLIGNYTKEEDLHKRPLSKLIKDISEELDLI